jgi:hypothetical protein
MSRFAVIRVDQDYDYVEGAECLDVFDTKEEAERTLVQVKHLIETFSSRRLAYNEGFVAGLPEPNLPQPPHTKQWEEYKSQFKYIPYGATPKDFKQLMLSALNGGYGKELDGYDPPPSIHGWNNLFVVEIKERPDRYAPWFPVVKKESNATDK